MQYKKFGSMNSARNSRASAGTMTVESCTSLFCRDQQRWGQLKLDLHLYEAGHKEIMASTNFVQRAWPRVALILARITYLLGSVRCKKGSASHHRGGAQPTTNHCYVCGWRNFGTLRSKGERCCCFTTSYDTPNLCWSMMLTKAIDHARKSEQ